MMDRAGFIFKIRYSNNRDKQDDATKILGWRRLRKSVTQAAMSFFYAMADCSVFVLLRNKVVHLKRHTTVNTPHMLAFFPGLRNGPVLILWSNTVVNSPN